MNNNRSYLASFFVILISLFPSLSKRLWTKWYDFLARHDEHNNFSFMNYGFHDDASKINLESCDEPNRQQIQLYEHVLSSLVLDNKILLEVGSGRGGGLDYLCRYKQFEKLIGIDISKVAVNKSAERFSTDSLIFLNAEADKIPLENNDVDIVINVESSHCYPDMISFVKETFRVLKPGGYLAICDIRNAAGVDKMEMSFNQCGYSQVTKSVITSNVLKSLEIMSDDRIKISNNVPSLLKNAFKDFAGVKSSSVYDLLKSNKLIYVSYLLKK